MTKKSSEIKILKPEDGFLGIEEKYTPKNQNAQIAIIPFGLEKSVSYGGGTKNGPKAIIKASKQVELFDEEFWCEPFREFAIETVKEFKVEEKIENALTQIEEIVEKFLSQNKFPLVLGGEHSITAGVIRPFVKKYSDLAILHFDAHADLRDGYDGEHFSHASALRRVMDHDIKTLVSCGIRNISASEIPFYEANKNRIKIHFAKDKKLWNINEIIEPLRGKSVFITFDIDGFDSTLMQATGTPEPNGLLWQETMEIIREASKISNVVGADVVELAPIKGFHSYDFLTAKLCYKILSYAFLAKKL